MMLAGSQKRQWLVKLNKLVIHTSVLAPGSKPGFFRFDVNNIQVNRLFLAQCLPLLSLFWLGFRQAY